ARFLRPELNGPEPIQPSELNLRPGGPPVVRKQASVKTNPDHWCIAHNAPPCRPRSARRMLPGNELSNCLFNPPCPCFRLLRLFNRASVLLAMGIAQPFPAGPGGGVGLDRAGKIRRRSYDAQLFVALHHNLDRVTRVDFRARP